MIAFTDAFLLAPDDAEIRTKMGKPQHAPGDTMLVVSLTAAGEVLIRLAITADEARRLAGAAEQTMRKLSRHPDAGRMPGLISVLLAGADELEGAE